MRSPLRPAPAAHKVVSAAALERAVRRLQSRGRRVVFTNGCFDLLHPGHLKVLERSRALGDALVVGLNSDRSVRAQRKDPGRPIVGQRDRALMLAALACVDFVTIFDEPTPERLVRRLQPDVLVKGADWSAGAIAGGNAVRARGGRVVRVPLLKGYSTTKLVERIQRAGCCG
jgi:D-beta-D-heptose 7-phosphate kinase/D-beta-D-heptose 1-phosphate adenosyltransferase